MLSSRSSVSAAAKVKILFNIISYPNACLARFHPHKIASPKVKLGTWALGRHGTYGSPLAAATLQRLAPTSGNPAARRLGRARIPRAHLQSSDAPRSR